MRIDTDAAKYGLRIVQPYRITKEEIAQRKRNLWLGLCQDRKLFWNPEYIKLQHNAVRWLMRQT